MKIRFYFPLPSITGTSYLSCGNFISSSIPSPPLSVVQTISNCSGLCLFKNVNGTPIAQSQSIGISADFETSMASQLSYFGYTSVEIADFWVIAVAVDDLPAIVISVVFEFFLNIRKLGVDLVILCLLRSVEIPIYCHNATRFLAYLRVLSSTKLVARKSHLRDSTPSPGPFPEASGKGSVLGGIGIRFRTLVTNENVSHYFIGTVSVPLW